MSTLSNGIFCMDGNVEMSIEKTKITNIVEVLAAQEHDRWSRWMEYLISKCEINANGSVTIPKEFVDHWTRQLQTDYYQLTPSERDSDRKESIRTIAALLKAGML